MLVRDNFFEESHEQDHTLQLFQFKGGVALGGTFDHLHNGHKLLLSQAMMCSDQRILCGVTTDKLLQKKAYAAYLEAYEVRLRSVEEFCKRVNPNLFKGDKKLVTFELEDPVGPTGTDPNLEALILTREVEKGGKMVNDTREKNGLRPVQLVFVDMILADIEEKSQFSNKTASTFIR